jgi:uncharacterized protein GlcG (DUF336 family)
MKKYSLALASILVLGSTAVFAGDDESDNCQTVLDAIGGHSNLQTQLTTARNAANGGFDFNMWASVVSDDGTICAVAKTGADINDQWLGSRVISAQKANTANAFSLQNSLSLSTANLWAATQPGGSLFGLQFSNPVDTKNAYRGNSKNYGNNNDPMVGKKVGGVNVFGGGLALYDADGNMIGAIGVSGDSSCADHNIAWRTRDLLALDHVPAGLSIGDNIIFDLDLDGNSASGFGHPTCTGDTENKDINLTVIADHPLGVNP